MANEGDGAGFEVVAIPQDPQRKSRPGIARLLAENPDRVVETFVDSCPHCAAAFARSGQTPQAVYDRIELLPIKPDITRVHLFGGSCGCCGGRAIAAAPAPSTTNTALKPAMKGRLALTILRPAPRSPRRSTSTAETADR